MNDAAPAEQSPPPVPVRRFPRRRNSRWLERGDEISPSISGAVASLEVCVVVIWESYAFSPWTRLPKLQSASAVRGRRSCPCRVSGQLGQVGEALDGGMAVYEKRWRGALGKVGNLSG
ncbi:unnamed protein product [Linum trigynum]|uniref:Uncharacterized protein n=1 Tax=Linum trigynum TaxID=586398 RepID=A0AAV2C631_9ROSI